MRILHLNELLEQPEGTIFCKVNEVWVNGNLSVFGGRCGDSDFIYLPLDNIEAFDSGEWAQRLDEMADDGASFPLDPEAFMRDGSFQSDDLFLVYEHEDLLELQKFIAAAINLTRD